MYINQTYTICILLCVYLSGLIFQTSNVIYRVGLLILVEQVGSFIIQLLGQNFLGLTYIIVYIGALAIQFLFVIMMLKPNPNYTAHLRVQLGFILLSILLGIGAYQKCLTFVRDLLPQGGYHDLIIIPSWTLSYCELNDIMAIAYMIYGAYPLLQVYVGIILFQVLIGIVIILGFKR